MNTNTIDTSVIQTEIKQSPTLSDTIIVLSSNALSLLIGLYSMGLRVITSQKANAVKTAKYSSIFAVVCIVAIIFMQLFLRAIDIEYEANLAVVEQHNAEIESSFFDDKNLK